jgi:hypothetical protein
MDLNKSSGPDVLPQEKPPSDLLVDVSLDELSELSQDRLHIALWTAAAIRLFKSRAVWRWIPGYRFAAFGFTDPDSEADAFGVVIFATPGLHLGRESFDLEGDGISFPVFVRRAVEHYHAPKINPTGGTASCWATSARLSAPLNSGLLTAKHLLSDPRIGAVTYTTAGPARVLDVGPDGVDAALIEAPRFPTPPSNSVLTVEKRVVAWDDVLIDGTQSGLISTKVTLVTDTRGSLSPSLPIRIYLAAHGLPGDSGALVKNVSGQGVGIYMGAMADMVSRPEGFCQHLGQAVEAMNLTLYE